MNYPSNTRIPEIWEVVQTHLDPADLVVADLGCGYGDLLVKFALHGASQVMGLDNNPTNIRILMRRQREQWQSLPIQIIHADVNAYCPPCDLALSFSVLPYLSDPELSLRSWRTAADRLLLEAQYQGDGPGFIHDDAHLHALLAQAGWEGEYLGYSVVQGRNTHRKIWLCQHLKTPPTT